MRRLFAVSLIVLALSGVVHAEQKWALLIGVNEYRVDRWKLKGCVNDVLMTKELLTTKFGFPVEIVKVLIDEVSNS